MVRNRVLMIGAGAVGSYIGGWLTHTGHDVTLLDAWTDHIDAISSGGLHLTGPHEPIIVYPRVVALRESQVLAHGPPFDLVFITVKSYDTLWAAHLAKRFVAQFGCIVSAQNGLNDAKVAAAVGEQHAVGLVMSGISVALWEVGRVERAGSVRRRDHGHDVFRVGEKDGAISGHSRDLAEMLEPIDGARTTTNLAGERWAKLCQNSMGNPVGAMTGLGTGPVMLERWARWLMIRLAADACRVGFACGIRIEDVHGVSAECWADAGRNAVFERLDKLLAERVSDNEFKNSMAQDVIKGRRTEIDELTGLVVGQAEKVGLQTPVSASTVNVIHEIEAGTLAISKDNAEMTLRRAGF